MKRRERMRFSFIGGFFSSLVLAAVAIAGSSLVHAGSKFYGDSDMSLSAMASLGPEMKDDHIRRGRTKSIDVINNRESKNDNDRGEGWKWWRYHELSEREILDHLVHRQRYDKREKPPSDGPLRINVSAILLTVDSDIDERSKKNSLDLFLHQNWFDPRLIHNDKNFPHLNGLYHNRDLWLPTSFFKKRNNNYETSGNEDIALNIYGNGSVEYISRCEAELQCLSDDPSRFPFDNPFCFFNIESGATSVEVFSRDGGKKTFPLFQDVKTISYSSKEVEWKWSEPRGVFLTSGLRPSGGLQLGSIFTLDCSDSILPLQGNHSCLSLKLVFSRDLNFYLLNNFLPDVVLVCCSFLTYWIDHASSMIARILLATLTLLNFSASVQQSSSLGSSEMSTALQTWHLLSLLFIFASCVQFVAVNFFVAGKTKTNRLIRLQGLRNRGETLSFQNDFRRQPEFHTATLRPHHQLHQQLHQQLQHQHSCLGHPQQQVQPQPQHINPSSSTSVINNENLFTSCNKCNITLGSPFRTTTEFSLTTTNDSLTEDNRSIGSGFFDSRKMYKDESTNTLTKDHYVSRTPNWAKKIDQFSRIFFPTLYLIFVFIYFCKYFA